MESIQNVNDLVVAAFFVGSAVAVFAIMIDHRIRKWNDTGKSYLSWILFSALLFAAILSAIFGKDLSELAKSLPPSLLIFDAMLFVGGFAVLNLGVRYLTKPQPFSRAFLERSLSEASLSLIVAILGITMYRILRIVVMTDQHQGAGLDGALHILMATELFNLIGLMTICILALFMALIFIQRGKNLLLYSAGACILSCSLFVSLLKI